MPLSLTSKTTRLVSVQPMPAGPQGRPISISHPLVERLARYDCVTDLPFMGKAAVTRLEIKQHQKTAEQLASVLLKPSERAKALSQDLLHKKSPVGLRLVTLQRAAVAQHVERSQGHVSQRAEMTHNLMLPLALDSGYKLSELHALRKQQSLGNLTPSQREEGRRLESDLGDVLNWLSDPLAFAQWSTTLRNRTNEECARPKNIPVNCRASAMSQRFMRNTAVSSLIEALPKLQSLPAIR